MAEAEWEYSLDPGAGFLRAISKIVQLIVAVLDAAFELANVLSQLFALSARVNAVVGNAPGEFGCSARIQRGIVQKLVIFQSVHGDAHDYLQSGTCLAGWRDSLKWGICVRPGMALEQGGEGGTIYENGNDNSIHRNQMGKTLQLQVDEFCLEIADAVDAWSASVADDQDIQARMASLLKIHNQVPFINYN
ncbi:hypothetical protein [Pseudomonas sp. GM55]|uniref:hypothetical protein n=1 Tax=Pseudomonas sp. GM55 TaxID=1144333 RepID=UPI00138AD340|nr:hypothetical protein [Pseudomonas sp. GM55]